jgi:hypothetical protein
VVTCSVRASAIASHQSRLWCGEAGAARPGDRLRHLGAQPRRQPRAGRNRGHRLRERQLRTIGHKYSSNPNTQNSHRDDLQVAILPGRGGRIRTCDLWVMSQDRPTSWRFLLLATLISPLRRIEKRNPSQEYEEGRRNSKKTRKSTRIAPLQAAIRTMAESSEFLT